jgi:hypothetical protein
MTEEELMAGNDLTGNNVLFQGTIPAFTWRACRKLQDALPESQFPL